MFKSVVIQKAIVGEFEEARFEQTKAGMNHLEFSPGQTYLEVNADSVRTLLRIQFYLWINCDQLQDKLSVLLPALPLPANFI
ncbi:hypothetical protein [Pantoea sp. CCBC3-3-1]|uniref:hypothetical protein n=1 Tax=Pantoea sp. CCBC3-3-1 TaxID=2490851 RepID=UPI0011BFBE82|nr:hypothetical protein [Pantoea sp. CCBC3-3-1]